MPLSRLIGSGMNYADALTLHASAKAGIRWDDCGEWLGERNLRLAGSASSPTSARTWYRFASACFRAAQSAIPTDSSRKRDLFLRMVSSFGAAGSLDQPATEKHEIAWGTGKLCGWLMRPKAVKAPPPVVVVMGGFDGWREEYHPGGEALVERGIAAFLVDGPGQGETRLQHGVFLDTAFPDAFAAIASYLRNECGLGHKVGIWGNSLGGFLAAKTVALHGDVFDALCVNGGTIRPLELPERYPRFFAKVEALLGTTDRKVVMETMTELDLVDDVSAIRCPILQLHSVPDQVFLLENARLIHDLCSSQDRQLLIWDDGDHCIYNHSEEKNALVSDWFASRLGLERIKRE